MKNFLISFFLFITCTCFSQNNALKEEIRKLSVDYSIEFVYLIIPTEITGNFDEEVVRQIKNDPLYRNTLTSANFKSNQLIYAIAPKSRKVGLYFGTNLNPILSGKWRDIQNHIKPLLKEKKWDESAIQVINETKALIIAFNSHKETATTNSKKESTPTDFTFLFYIAGILVIGVITVQGYIRYKKYKVNRIKYLELKEKCQKLIQKLSSIYVELDTKIQNLKFNIELFDSEVVFKKLFDKIMNEFNTISPESFNSEDYLKNSSYEKLSTIFINLEATLKNSTKLDQEIQELEQQIKKCIDTINSKGENLRNLAKTIEESIQNFKSNFSLVNIPNSFTIEIPIELIQYIININKDIDTIVKNIANKKINEETRTLIVNTLIGLNNGKYKIQQTYEEISEIIKNVIANNNILDQYTEIHERNKNDIWRKFQLDYKKWNIHDKMVFDTKVLSLNSIFDIHTTIIEQKNKIEQFFMEGNYKDAYKLLSSTLKLLSEYNKESKNHRDQYEKMLKTEIEVKNINIGEARNKISIVSKHLNNSKEFLGAYYITFKTKIIQLEHNIENIIKAIESSNLSFVKIHEDFLMYNSKIDQITEDINVKIHEHHENIAQLRRIKNQIETQISNTQKYGGHYSHSKIRDIETKLNNINSLGITEALIIANSLQSEADREFRNAKYNYEETNRSSSYSSDSSSFSNFSSDSSSSSSSSDFGGSSSF